MTTKDDPSAATSEITQPQAQAANETAPDAAPAAPPAIVGELSHERELTTKLRGQVTSLEATIDALRHSMAETRFDMAGWLQWLIQNWPVAQKLIGLWGEWNSITVPITDHNGMKMRILVAVKLAKYAASLTPTQVDDEAEAALEQLLNAPGGVLDSLADLLIKLWPMPATQNAIRDPESVYSAEHLNTIKSRFADHKINWGTLLGLLPTIIAIIQTFTGVKIPIPTLPGPAPAAKPAKALPATAAK